MPAAVRDIARARPDGKLRYTIPGKGPDNPECRVVAATQDQGWRPRSSLRSWLSRCHYRLPRAWLSSVEDDEGAPEDVARTPPVWVTRGAQHGLKVGSARFVVKRRDRLGWSMSVTNRARECSRKIPLRAIMHAATRSNERGALTARAAGRNISLSPAVAEVRVNPLDSRII